MNTPNIPNLITFLRILLIPVFVAVYIIPGQLTYLLAAILFSLAAITDWLDGYLARRLQQMTRFGAFLDPVADKLMVVVALVMLIGSYHNLLFTLPALVIIGREIMISALREWMAEMNRRGVVAVSWIGKVKTTMQMIAVIILLANPPFLDRPWVIVGYVFLYAAAILTLWSMVVYLRAAWPTLKEGMHGG